MFAGMVSVPLAVSPGQTRTRPPADYRHDPRLGLLQRFFERGACPARELSHVFLEAADDYALDWRLLPSLSWVESTGGKMARNNNMFGWDSGRASFSSLSAGIHVVGYRLAKSGLYRDKSIDQILSTYNPSADYVRKVKSVLRRISPSD
jgi:hypothetical protein